MENLFSTLNLAYDLKTAAKLFEYEVVVLLHLIYRGENAIKKRENLCEWQKSQEKTFISALKYYGRKNLIF